MINPQWLQTFALLAELGNFTRTGERLGLTQAAVSQHMRHLEAQFGALVIRRPRKLELTPTGQAVLDYHREVQHAAERLQQRIAEGDADAGDVGLITPGSIGLALYPLLLDWQHMNPGLVVRHRFAPDQEILGAVLRNQYELGVVTVKPDDPQLRASPFAEESLELVVPSGARVDGWDDLVRLGFIDHPDGEAMANRLLSRLFAGGPGLGAVPKRGFSNQVALILEPVARGFGFTVLPKHARQAFVRQNEIQVMCCETPVVDRLWLIHRAEWPISKRAARTVEFLRRQLASTQAATGASTQAAA